MRWMLIAAMAASPALWAQRNPSPTGFGRIMFPGGTSSQPTATAGRILFPGTGAPAVTRGGGFGAPVFVGPGRAPLVSHQAHAAPVVIPYPVFYAGGYYDYDAPPAAYAQPVAQPPAYLPYLAPQPAYPPGREPAVVIINQYFREDAAPVTTRNGAAPGVETEPQQSQLAPAPAEEGPIFMIALTDHTILAARAYWIEEGVLHYITVQGVEDSAPMELVDRELSRRLNRDRNVAFGLPAN